MNKRKDFTPKNEIDEARKKKANIKLLVRLFFWFSSDS